MKSPLSLDETLAGIQDRRGAAASPSGKGFVLRSERSLVPAHSGKLRENRGAVGGYMSFRRFAATAVSFGHQIPSAVWAGWILTVLIVSATLAFGVTPSGEIVSPRVGDQFGTDPSPDPRGEDIGKSAEDLTIATGEVQKAS